MQSGGSPGLSSAQSIVLDASSDPQFSNGTISVDISPSTLSTASGVVARSNTAGNGYLAELISDPLGQSAVLIRVDDFQTPADGPFIILQDVWEPGGNYQMDVSFNGPEFTLAVTDLATQQRWMGSGFDDTYDSGQVELLVINSPFVDVGPIGADFDNVEVEFIPEPSSSFLATWALGMAGLFRRNRGSAH